MEDNSVPCTEKKNSDSETIPSNLEWLQGEAPGFSVCGDKVNLLFTPGEFYSAIIDGCSRAKRRITLAALYIGLESLEKKLVEVLDQRMTDCGKDLHVRILLDAVRDSRDHSARSQLLPLIRKHSHCQVSLYHTPELRGVLLRLLPLKVNETIGVQHIKLYIFDDDIIISGANLTKDYFTDRQDRYMLISECQRLADFSHGLIERIISISLRLTEDNCLVPTLPHLHPYLNPQGQYEKHARDLIWGYYNQVLNNSNKTLKPGDDTWVFPLLQLPPLQILQDSLVTQSILESTQPQSTIHLASAYFNLPEEYITSFLHKVKAAFNILIPHPTNNDFYGAGGFVGQIPSLYSLSTTSFLQRVIDANQDKRISVMEYEQPGGSYHSKGIWISALGDECPFMTIVGSSNFNYRSVRRDLECQMVVLTSNKGLRRRLQDEKQRLYKHGVPFTHDVALRPDRKPKFWQHIFLWLFKGFF